MLAALKLAELHDGLALECLFQLKIIGEGATHQGSITGVVDEDPAPIVDLDGEDLRVEKPRLDEAIEAVVLFPHLNLDKLLGGDHEVRQMSEMVQAGKGGLFEHLLLGVVGEPGAKEEGHAHTGPGAHEGESSEELCRLHSPLALVFCTTMYNRRPVDSFKGSRACEAWGNAWWRGAGSRWTISPAQAWTRRYPGRLPSPLSRR